jgi:hypothetical protein
MRNRLGDWDILILIILLAGLFWVRMELSTSTTSLSYDSYLTVRAVEHIQETGAPLRADPLSITGTQRITNPIFDYVLAGLIFISPMIYKILPNLFMILALVPLYFLALRFSQSKPASLIAVILAGTGPIVFSNYLNTPSEVPIAAFLLLSILAMLHDPDQHLFAIIISAIILTFVSPLIFVLALSLLGIMILLRVEGFGLDERVGELFFFTLLLSVWFYVIIYKQALFSQGLNVVWQNLPTDLASITFGNFSLLTALYGLGVITFLLGAFGVYHALFETREKASYSIVAAILAVVVALTFRVITVNIGLILLTFFLAIMAGYGLLISVRYLSMTKMPWIVYPLGVIVVIFFIFTAILPALVNARLAMGESPTEEDIAAFTALRLRLPETAILLVPIKEAAAIQYYSKHITVTDSDFLMVNNGDELVRDIDAVYTSRFSTAVIGKASKLGFTHILFTRTASIKYGRDMLYSEDPVCLPHEKIVNVLVYSVRCKEEL